MQPDEYFAALGISDGFAAVMATTELGVLALTVVLLSASFVLCVLAFRAAGAARRAKNDAAQMLGAMEDYAVEIRQLTAQAERASLRFQERGPDYHHQGAGLAERINAVRVGPGLTHNRADNAPESDMAGETSDQSSVDQLPGHMELASSDKAAHQDESAAPQPETAFTEDEGDTQENVDEEGAVNERLASAAKAISEPSALLRGILRRR